MGNFILFKKRIEIRANIPSSKQPIFLLELKRGSIKKKTYPGYQNLAISNVGKIKKTNCRVLY